VRPAVALVMEVSSCQKKLSRPSDGALWISVSLSLLIEKPDIAGCSSNTGGKPLVSSVGGNR
jgi:hypothetical protein